MNPGELVGEEAPSTPDSGLNLVEDEQELAPVTDFAQAPEESERDHPHAALTLDGLDHNGGALRPDRGLNSGEVAHRDLVESLDLGPEPFKVFLLAAGGDGGERAAVKSALERQDAIALRMAVDPLAPARHLDRRLVGLSARIGEEHEIGEGRIRQTAGKPFAFRILVQVRDVPELRALTGQRLHHMGMGVSDRGHRNAGAEVEIAFAGRRDQPAPLSTLEGDVCARVG